MAKETKKGKEGPKDNGIYKYLDACTSHITEKDMRLLDYACRPRIEHGIVSVPHEHGAWIHCLDEIGDDFEEIRKGGFSKSFIKLLAFARANGCAWINIDSDGFRHDQLREHSW